MQLQLEKVNKSFGAHHVLKDVSFTARSGVSMGLLGRNGSGKTTTIRVIMDLFPSDSGTATIDGKPSKQFLSKIGYLPEERGLYPNRLISEQMSYIGELRGMKPADAKARGKMLLEKLEAEEYYKKKLSTLSKGNQQKIQLAIALINDPEIVILDEPFSGLDPVNAKILKSIVLELVKENRLVVFSSHQMGYVEEFCDDVCIINDGKIVLDGNLRQIKKSYPRDRIMLVPENNDPAGLKKKIDLDPNFRAFMTDSVVKGVGCVITLKNENDKNLFFQSMAKADFGIDSLQVCEPTLEEIFVEKAGDVHETV